MPVIDPAPERHMLLARNMVNGTRVVRDSEYDAGAANSP
jgi:hypothetical protein